MALASAKLFEHAMREHAENYMDHVEFLHQAFICAQKALEIYDGKYLPQQGKQELLFTKSFTENQNPYGMALANFTLGYLYEHFYSTIIDEKFVEKYGNDYSFSAEESVK